MTSLVATPTTSSFLHPQGILLNRNDVTPLTTPKRFPIDLPAPLPRSNSNSSSNSSDASPSDSPPRKIRFAPLPDPRRAPLATETLAGDLSPAATESQDPVAAPTSTSAGELIALTPVTSISGDSTVNGDDSDSRAESGSDFRSGAKRNKSKKWGKRLFGPLLKASASSSSKDDGPALPSDSSHSHGTNVPDLGFPLGRRTSTGSTEPLGRGRASMIGSPLTLTRSAEGGGTAPVRQQRMLNGRVYGARQAFQNATTEEPAFVEWGYGGMGAVNSSGGSQYARLQSSNKLSLGTEASTAEEDDGSGMAWVMKRRAAREEKARKEKEAALEAERAKEASKEAEPNAAQTTSEVKTQPSDSGDVEMRPETPKAATNRPPILPPSRRSTEGRTPDVTSPTSPTSDHEEHHTVKTVSIPNPQPRPHHTRSQSIGSLKERVALPASPPGSERESEPGSTTEDDDDEESTSEAEPEEDMEEEERKTALCAGLEKVSRHT